MNSASSATNTHNGPPPAASKLPRLRDLSGPRQALLRLFQTINFGHVDRLEVRGGEPVFNAAPLVFIELKLDAEDGRREEHDLGNFDLRVESLPTPSGRTGRARRRHGRADRCTQGTHH